MENQKNMYLPCGVCGETHPELFKIWFDGYIKLYKCLKCGFVSQFPGPGNYTIVNDYQDRYSLDFLKQGKEFMYPYRRRVFQDTLNRILAIKKTGTILDVGCGDGHFLYLCTQKGLKCSGVEESTELSSFASQKTNANIIKGKYNKKMFPAESFDIITLIQVLEHIPIPSKALEIANHHLRKDGILVIEIPSINSPNFLGYRLTGIKKIVSPPSGVIYSHCGYYSPKSLLTLTQNCGYEKLSLVTGRWQYKYNSYKQIGRFIDPILNKLRIGGILYIGTKKGEKFIDKDHTTLPN
jgi:SAM-dependent methyltransferase